MNPQDRVLDMERSLTRRDFLDGTARIIGGALTASVIGAAEAGTPTAATASASVSTSASASEAFVSTVNSSDPPMRMGMRGFDDAAMMAGHAIRDGQHPQHVEDTGEHYDLIVVGSGMSGLSVAYFYRQQVPGAKILVIEGCDDFGGHARRVEFNVDGRQLLVCGGTEELWNPGTFSPESWRMLEDIGIDRQRASLHAKADKDAFQAHGLKPATFFAREIFGEDRLVTDKPSLQEATPAQLRAWFDRTPMSDALKTGLLKLYTDDTDYLHGLSMDEKIARLRTMSYTDYLAHVARIGPEAVAYILRNGSGDSDNTSSGPDTYSAWYAWRRNRRGFAGLGLPRTRRVTSLAADPGENIAFPDGNAGVARLLIRSLIPQALAGNTAEDSIRMPLRYDALDVSQNDVRIRLSSMVMRVQHRGDPAAAQGVDITYLRDGAHYRVHADHVVMACFNAMVPHLVPALPETQKAALRMAVRKPLVRSFVALRNWNAFARLGVQDVDCPGMFFRHLQPWSRPEWGGAYRNARTPDEPVIVYLDMARELLELHGTALPPRERWKAARAQLLAIDYEMMERNLVSQLERVLGAGGFDAHRDIAGITVCRWSHGYAGGANELYDPDWSHRDDAPWVIGRQRFGRIAIANSDAAATSLTSAAFAQGHRAVMELVNDIVRPVYDFRWSERDTSVEP